MADEEIVRRGPWTDEMLAAFNALHERKPFEDAMREVGVPYRVQPSGVRFRDRRSAKEDR